MPIIAHADNIVINVRVLYDTFTQLELAAVERGPKVKANQIKDMLHYKNERKKQDMAH